MTSNNPSKTLRREEPAFLSIPTFFEYPALPKVVECAILTKYLKLKAHLNRHFVTEISQEIYLSSFKDTEGLSLGAAASFKT